LKTTPVTNASRLGAAPSNIPRQIVSMVGVPNICVILTQLVKTTQSLKLTKNTTPYPPRQKQPTEWLQSHRFSPKPSSAPSFPGLASKPVYDGASYEIGGIVLDKVTSLRDGEQGPVVFQPLPGVV
jgi:hypothetical protein